MFYTKVQHLLSLFCSSNRTAPYKSPTRYDTTYWAGTGGGKAQLVGEYHLNQTGREKACDFSLVMNGSIKMIWQSEATCSDLAIINTIGKIKIERTRYWV